MPDNELAWPLQKVGNMELPAVIQQLIRKQQPKMEEVIHGNQYGTIFHPYSVWNPDLSQLLIQEGILTVKEYVKGPFISHYKCGFPNYEVQVAFEEIIDFI